MVASMTFDKLVLLEQALVGDLQVELGLVDRRI
jgi:hypothetical protein